MQISGGTSVNAFAVDGTYAYFGAPDTTVVRMLKQGGATESLGLHVNQALFAMTSTSLYTWAYEGTTLYRIPLAGGPGTMVTSSLPPVTNTIAVEPDESVAYVASSTQGLFVLHLADATLDPMAPGSAWNVVMDDNALYFTTSNNGPTGSNAVMSIPKGGGIPNTLATSTYAFAIALSGDHLYYTDEWAGTVQRVSKQGGLPTLVTADVDSYPTAIVTDDTCVYWATIGGVWAAPLL
jgi:sugar lactone lactonase YvrE